MWVNPIRQAEGRVQVAFQLRYFLDERQELTVNSLLVLFPLLCQLVLLQMAMRENKVVGYK